MTAPAFKITITRIPNGSTEPRTTEDIYPVDDFDPTIQAAYRRAIARWHHIHNVIANRGDTLVSGTFSRI